MPAGRLFVNSQLLSAKNVIVQGITGSHGTFHARAMRDAGTNVVAGTSPNKAGQFVDDIPVYASIVDIQKDFMIDTSIVFVPAPLAKAALLETIKARVPLIICITEGIPIHDMLAIKTHADHAGVKIIGPNCPGILIPGGNKLGIIPAQMAIPGNVGIVSRSGTLTYEAAASLSAKGIGQKYIIGIGGDPVRGTDFVDCLSLFEQDPDVHSIVMIGEIGGKSEYRAAKYIKAHMTKPVYAYVAGHTAPLGVQLGHAGAILGSNDESASAKTIALRQAGTVTSNSIVELVDTVA
jgi:succinyl-CoA synthetase alpha subunit